MEQEAQTPASVIQRLRSRCRYHTFEVRMKLHQWCEKAFMWFIWKLPRGIIYFAVIRMWAHGTTGQYGNTHPEELTWNEALKRWRAG